MRLLQVLSGSAVLLPALALVAWAGTPGPRPDAKSHAKSGTGKPSVGAAAVPLVSFRESIEPYLKTACTVCHNPGSPASGLDMDSTTALFKGGKKFGAKAIVAGNAKDSALVAYLRGQHQPRMPMGREAVPEAQIKLIETWINQGAKVDAIKLGWPYTSPVAQRVPNVKNAAWTRTPIDNFILAKLESKGLKPALPAPKITLLRRVYADLVGMPPTAAEAATFLNDNSPKAYENLVDKLLADPRYGERWGRHWLDLVRYADTDGFENDGERPRAWRYRDYVIAAFNKDKPYDRFLKEQVAGDELYPGDADAITATGYARLAPWDSLSTDPPQRWQDFLNDVTDTTGSVMLGLTVGCAKCHNHKYDRISQADYYRMQAFFTPLKWQDTRLPDSVADSSPFKQKVADAKAELEPLRRQLKEMLDTYRAEVVTEKRKTAKPGEQVTADDDEIENAIRKYKKKDEEYNQLRGDIERLEREIRPLEPIAEAITDEGKNAKPTHVLLRGDLHAPGPEVQPGFVASLVGGEEKPAPITPPDKGNTTGRRAALANWIANKDNPVTARVMVNRIWQHHFGYGIVGTPSDFGRNGDKPTHPELLDWLALRFENEGWSVKQIHRLMLLSNTYRQSTQINPIGVKTDPTNKLLWRMNRIRLEGEALRDSILTVSGRLNLSGGGPGVYPKVSDEVLSTGSTHKWGSSSDEDGRRRTVYVFQRRSLALPIVEAFDGPDMVNTCPRRTTTTIAPQALAMFNGDFSREEARYFAERVRKEAGDDTSKQIAHAYEIALIRKPTAAQQALALDFLQKQTRLHLQDEQKEQAGGARAGRRHVQSDACARCKNAQGRAAGRASPTCAISSSTLTSSCIWTETSAQTECIQGAIPQFGWLLIFRRGIDSRRAVGYTQD